MKTTHDTATKTAPPAAANPTPPDRLLSYLGAAIGAASLAGTVDAAVVNLDISSIDGPNAGLPANTSTSVGLSSLHPDLVGTLRIDTNPGTMGLTGNYPSGIAALGGYAHAAPRIFSITDVIDSSSYFSYFLHQSGFTDSATNSTAPDRGEGSFMGFVSDNGHYGWLEVTWDSTTQVFEILGGAFEDVAGVGIQAGAVAAVPEPAGALGTLGLLSAGMFLRRRKLAA